MSILRNNYNEGGKQLQVMKDKVDLEPTPNKSRRCPKNLVLKVELGGRSAFRLPVRS